MAFFSQVQVNSNIKLRTIEIYLFSNLLQRFSQNIAWKVSSNSDECKSHFFIVQSITLVVFSSSHISHQLLTPWLISMSYLCKFLIQQSMNLKLIFRLFNSAFCLTISSLHFYILRVDLPVFFCFNLRRNQEQT